MQWATTEMDMYSMPAVPSRVELSTPATNMPPEGNLFRLKCFSFPTSTRPPYTTFTGRPDCGPLCFDDFLILHPVSAFSPSQQRPNQRKKIRNGLLHYIQAPATNRRRRHTTTGAHFHLSAISDYLCRANTTGPGHKTQTCAAPFQSEKINLVRSLLLWCGTSLAWSNFTDVFISLPVRMCCSGQAGVCFFFFAIAFLFVSSSNANANGVVIAAQAVLPLM